MIAQSMHSQGQEYVNSMWFELPPHSPLSKFRDAWTVVCKEHEMLRTGFSATDDIEHPFAMITYVKDSFELPWSEAANESYSKAAIVRQLSRPPWGLVVEREERQTLVKFIAHHALYDAQSIRLILSDVSNAYACRQIPTRPSITHLLGSILSDKKGETSAKRQFWEREENKIIVNRFPDLTPLRVLDSAVVVREVFSQASTTELEECCRNNGATMQAASQAAWARLLSAYIGETSSTFGMTLSGRSSHEDADTISFPSIVTLPVRCEVTGTNEELLSRTMTSNASLHKHQFTPLTSIQKWARHLEGKIFDTLFAFQKVPDGELEVEQPWKIAREEASVDYAVSLEVQPTPSGQVALRLTFKDDLIPVEHADLLLRQYDLLLLDTLHNPRNQCDVAPEAASYLLSITPAKEEELPGPVTLLHEFVERGAREWPDRTALEFTSRLGQDVESRSWTYNELNKEGNKVAQLLLQRKVSQGQIVAICFDKCAEASFAIIGILKVGCAYVALDPQAPADRLKFILEDSGATIILTGGEPAKNMKAWMSGTIIALDSHGIFEGYSSEQPSLPRYILPSDTSYCLYTSGTTGTPKGCLISHENAVQAMLSFQRLFAGHWETDSKWLQFASFHFDVSVLEQFWSWSVGICVASAPRDFIFEDIPSAIRQLGITHIDLTPSLARLLRPDDTPLLCKGVFITGGEQLKQEILDAWGEHACIYNGYGPTEATIGVTMNPRVPQNGKPANIGPQFDNVGSFVLKPGTALPVLRGGVGELCVSGKLVGTGYLNRPDLTNERFPTL
jgi:amino acid adenylation domain-containing protein